MNRKLKIISMILVLAMAAVLPMAGITAASADSGALTYTDVPQGSWYYGYVKYVTQAGYMKGTSETTFGPKDTMTRAMFVTTLARVAGAQTNDMVVSSFKDVQAAQWYTGAIQWAADNKIVSGRDDGTFGLSDPVTRQDAAVILYNYMQTTTMPAVDASAPAFTDEDQISKYAKEAVTEVSRCNVLSGYEDQSFRPKNNITRAEAAAIIYRLVKFSKGETIDVPANAEPGYVAPTTTQTTSTTAASSGNGKKMRVQLQVLDKTNNAGWTYSVDYDPGTERSLEQVVDDIRKNNEVGVKQLLNAVIQKLKNTTTTQVINGVTTQVKIDGSGYFLVDSGNKAALDAADTDYKNRRDTVVWSRLVANAPGFGTGGGTSQKYFQILYENCKPSYFFDVHGDTIMLRTADKYFDGLKLLISDGFNIYDGLKLNTMNEYRTSSISRVNAIGGVNMVIDEALSKAAAANDANCLETYLGDCGSGKTYMDVQFTISDANAASLLEAFTIVGYNYRIPSSFYGSYQITLSAAYI